MKRITVTLLVLALGSYSLPTFAGDIEADPASVKPMTVPDIGA
jgi:hypothetical protein